MLPVDKCRRARARIKSCGGVGVQWLAAVPTSPKSMFTDEDFKDLAKMTPKRSSQKDSFSQPDSHSFYERRGGVMEMKRG